MGNLKVKCDRCKKGFKSDEIAWRIFLSLTADPVLGVNEYANLSAVQLDGRLSALLDRIAMIPEDMLEDQVYQEFAFLVCSKCRAILAANPLQCR